MTVDAIKLIRNIRKTKPMLVPLGGACMNGFKSEARSPKNKTVFSWDSFCVAAEDICPSAPALACERESAVWPWQWDSTSPVL